jgi:sensor domain CHASE-containing protein
MSLRKKTLLVVGLTLVALMVVVYAVTSRVVLRGIADLEERRTREHVAPRGIGSDTPSGRRPTGRRA